MAPVALPPPSAARYISRLFEAVGLFDKDVCVKHGIHPTYQRANVQCACGNTFVTQSTVASIHVEICSRCHPYYTGKQKLVDTAGRVERFRQKYGTEKAAG